MTPSIETKYNHYYSQHCKHLKLQGLQPKTIEAYSRGIRRIAAYFNGHLDDLSQDQLLDYFHSLRRARNYGFLHPNSKVLINILQCLNKLNPKKVLEKIRLRQRPQLSCECCGGKMEINRTRIPVIETLGLKSNRPSLVLT